MEFAWYTIITFAGQELKAKSLIEAMIEREPDGEELFGRVEVPYIREKIIRKTPKGKQTTKEETRLLFPTYIFLQIAQNEVQVEKIKSKGSKETELITEKQINERARHLVLTIQGVTRFLTIGNEIKSVPDEEMSKILPDLNGGNANEEILEVIPIKEGDQIRIKEGPFNDYTGVVEEIMKDRSKLKAMVVIFGRSIPVELNFSEVEVL